MWEISPYPVRDTRYHSWESPSCFPTKETMTRPILIAIATMAAVAACATGPSGPPPFNPVGSYTYTADVDGQPLPGTMTIMQGESGYEGTILSDVFPAISITSVVVEGQAGTIEAAGPEGPLVIEFVAIQGTMEGTWAMGEQGGAFTATKGS